MKDYKWAIVSSILVVFSCLGLARFAFGMILPNMQIDLNLNNTQIGWIGSANFLGYLLGLLFSGRFYNKFGASTLIFRSLLTQSASMIAMAFCTTVFLASISFFVTGFFGALANISIMTYIAQIVPQNIRGKATGMVVIGIGSAIIFSGFVVPILNSYYDQLSWKYSWIGFSIIIFFISFIIKKGLVHTPHDTHKNLHNQLKILQTLIDSNFIKVASIYLLFGITYVVYITFFVLASEVKWSLGTNISGSFWALLGFSSLFAGPIFGTISDKIGTFRTLSLIFFINIISHLILALDTPVYMLWVSAFLFGVSAWGVPSIMAVLSSELFGIANTAKILSLVTIFFGIGQILGPVGAGALVDKFGDFSYAFGLSATLTFLGFISSLYFSLHVKTK
ncbi:YbfB/YjiJ family MFS transporter [Sulfurospirillum sp. 1307]